MGTLRKALGIALGGHVLVVLAFSRVHVPDEPTLIGEQTILFEEGPASGDGQPVVAPISLAPKRSVPVEAMPGRHDVALAIGTSTGDRASGLAGDVSQPLTVGDSGGLIGLYEGLANLGRERTTGPEKPPPEDLAAEHSLRDALAEQDRAHGLARTGPLVTAAHSAASSNGPVHGATTIEVDCDGFGVVTSARADNSLWDRVAAGIVAEMKGKTVRVPPGVGLRTRLRVVAELARPSGEHGSMSIGAVSDDAPGADKSCVGIGIFRKCLTGMPVGFTYAKKDLSNAGVARKRVVHVDILSEAELR